MTTPLMPATVTPGQPATATPGQPTRNRANNWAERDRVLCLQIILDHEEELYGKHRVADKKRSWDKVQNLFNTRSDDTRTSDQIKKCFENMRSMARRYLDDRGQIRMRSPDGTKLRPPSRSTQLLIDRISWRVSIGGSDSDFYSQDINGYNGPDNSDLESADSDTNHSINTKLPAVKTEPREGEVEDASPPEPLQPPPTPAGRPWSTVAQPGARPPCSDSHSHGGLPAAPHTHFTQGMNEFPDTSNHHSVTINLPDHNHQSVNQTANQSTSSPALIPPSKRLPRLGGGGGGGSGARSPSELLLQAKVQRVKAERLKFMWETRLIKQRYRHEAQLHKLKLAAMETSLNPDTTASSDKDKQLHNLKVCATETSLNLDRTASLEKDQQLHNIHRLHTMETKQKLERTTMLEVGKQPPHTAKLFATEAEEILDPTYSPDTEDDGEPIY